MVGRAIPRAARAKRVMMKVSFILEFCVFLKLLFEADLSACKKLVVYSLVCRLEGNIYKYKSTSTSFCVF
jgi:hypothetical protein